MSITPEPPPPDIYAWRPRPRRPKGSPWLTIWSAPRATVRHIMDTDPDRWVIFPLAMAGGVAESYWRAAIKNVGDEMSLSAVLTVYLLIGALSGLITLFVGGWCLTWTGWWLGGRGTFPQVRVALAWGQVPIIWGLLLLAIGLVFFGNEVFASYTPTIDRQPALTLSLMLVYCVVVMWWAVVQAKCLAEAHQFSVWLGLGSFVLAGVVMTLFMLLTEGLVFGSVSL